METICALGVEKSETTITTDPFLTLRSLCTYATDSLPGQEQ